jgi:hypothetical protein
MPLLYFNIYAVILYFLKILGTLPLILKHRNTLISNLTKEKNKLLIIYPD